jgi:hypothetical protein
MTGHPVFERDIGLTVDDDVADVWPPEGRNLGRRRVWATQAESGHVRPHVGTSASEPTTGRERQPAPA